MQKILNDPERFVDEMLDGILAAHARDLQRVGPRGVLGVPSGGNPSVRHGREGGCVGGFVGRASGRWLCDWLWLCDGGLCGSVIRS